MEDNIKGLAFFLILATGFLGKLLLNILFGKSKSK